MIRYSYRKAAAFCFALLLSFGIGSAAVTAQDAVNMDVQVSNDELVQGEVLVITFSAEDAESLYFYGLEVIYDQERFTFVDVEPGVLMGENPLKIADNLDDSRIGASVVRTSGSGDGSGTVAELYFQVNEGSSAGPAQFSFQNADLRNTSGSTVPLDMASFVEVTTQQVDTFTVYYNNPDNWAQVFTYAFSSSGGDYITWPGELMNEPETGSVWYSYEVPVTFDNVIFNNNSGAQTGDLERNTDGWYDGNQWFDQEPDLDAERPVTFFVDMSVQIQRGNFDPEVDAISVAGSFSDWSTVEMTEEEDQVYSITLDVTGPEQGMAFYKFVLNDVFELDDQPNREFELGPDGEPIDLPVVFFDNDDGADIEPDTRPVMFSVDMSAQADLDNFDPETEVVYVRGSFNGWDDGILLSDTGDLVFETTFDIEGSEGEIVSYKFYYAEEGDFDGGTWESNDVGQGGTNDRQFELGPADLLQELDTVFFNNQEPDDPDPDTRPVAFSVDMSVQANLGFYDPEAGDVIYVRGDFNGFSTDDPLTSDNGFVYSATIDVAGSEGTETEYKFFIEAGDGRDLPNGGWEIDDVGQGGSNNRQFELGPADLLQELDTVFFNNQEAEPEPDTRPVAFSVDMSVQSQLGFYDPDAGDVVYVRGDFNDFDTDNPLTSDNGLVYSATIDVEGTEGTETQYKFFVEAGDGRELPNGGWELLNGDPDLNRSFDLGPVDILQELDTVFFNDQDEAEPDPDSRPVTFSVDMSVQSQLSFYNPDAGDVVYVRGDFNDFGTDNPLTLSADMVYEATIDIEGEEGTAIGYKFFVEAGDDRELPNDGWELLNDDPDLNRSFELGPADVLQELDTVFFNDDDGEVPPEFVTVWPGDTNNDGVVNEEDVLPLGIYWNMTGPARDDASIEWEGQLAEAWDPVAATYADTDGSGTVDQTDLLAVGLNFGETHGDGLSTQPPIAEVSLPPVNAGDRFIFTLSAGEMIELQGASFAFELEGVDEENFEWSQAEAGSWADDWKAENKLLDFNLIDGFSMSGARVHKGQTEAQLADEWITFEIEALQDWTSGATLLVKRASYVDSESAQQPLDEVDVTFTIETGTSSETDEIPRTTALHQNYPNPFNPTTNIVFDLSEQASVTIEVVNILGQRVALLADREEMRAGTHTTVFDGSRLTSGVYLIRMQAGSEQFTRKMMLVK